jgi:site-specific DNA-methyltransferase (adenine-specific)
MGYELVHGDCFEWMSNRAENSIHAVVTDPPFGLLEYTGKEIKKMRAGRGGVWRIPPEIGGSKRRPLPRFTVLTDDDIQSLRDFFYEWSLLVYRVLTPGGHLFIATNPLLSYIVAASIIKAGFERRGEIVRLVRTFRGGDRPKGAEEEFKEVCSMPRACYEPWGLYRKPFEGRLADNLRKWKAGGLRRYDDETPFSDVIESTRTPQAERDIAPHPSLKPQSFMRQIVWAALPLGEGVILDPFMGGGSTIAAAEAIGYDSIGVEIDLKFYEIAKKAVPALSKVSLVGESSPADTQVTVLQETLPLFNEL